MRNSHLIACVLVIMTSFCTVRTADAADRINIVAAENFYGALAKQIGGNAVDVTSILSSPDQDPHLFEASPSTARALAAADIVIYNGAGYDGWIDHLAKGKTHDGSVDIVAARLVGATTGDNPHLWYKPETFPAVAARLAHDLSRMEPDHAAMFSANLDKFEARYAGVTTLIASIRQAYSGTTVTATEPVFGYMAKALGFEVVNEGFQRAMMNDTEPGPRTVAAFEKSLADGSVKILFYNSQVTDPTAERLRKQAIEHGVAVVGITETMPRSMTIGKWLSGQLHSVADALAKNTQ